MPSIKTTANSEVYMLHDETDRALEELFDIWYADNMWEAWKVWKSRWKLVKDTE